MRKNLLWLSLKTQNHEPPSENCCLQNCQNPFNLPPAPTFLFKGGGGAVRNSARFLQEKHYLPEVMLEIRLTFF